MHRKPQYLAVLVEIHSQPQSISVHNAHSLDELALPVASIDTADNNLSQAFSCTQDRGVWVIEDDQSRRGPLNLPPVQLLSGHLRKDQHTILCF